MDSRVLWRVLCVCCLTLPPRVVIVLVFAGVDSSLECHVHPGRVESTAVQHAHRVFQCESATAAGAADCCAGCPAAAAAVVCRGWSCWRARARATRLRHRTTERPSNEGGERRATGEDGRQTMRRCCGRLSVSHCEQLSAPSASQPKRLRDAARNSEARGRRNNQPTVGRATGRGREGDQQVGRAAAS